MTTSTQDEAVAELSYADKIRALDAVLVGSAKGIWGIDHVWNPNGSGL